MVCICVAAGWFSLNVPSGLTLYWFVNNIISTGMQLYMRNTIKVDVPALASDGPSPIIDVSSTVIKPKEDRSKQVRGLDKQSMLVWWSGALLDFVGLFSCAHSQAGVLLCHVAMHDSLYFCFD